MVEGTLVPSSTGGCYAIDHAAGFEITGGQQCEILLAGNWIPGKVEQSSESVVSTAANVEEQRWTEEVSTALPSYRPFSVL